MDLLKVDSIDDAVRKLKKCCGAGFAATELAGLETAAGRVLAENIISAEDIPPYRRSAVDGYAVRSRDVGAAGDMIPTMLKITGEIAAGQDPGDTTVDKGCCVYVSTGSAVPEGADAVVMVEYCESFGGNMLAVSKAASPGEHVVRAGEDMQKGDVILQKGRKLRAQDIGVLAALGITVIPVFRPWDITIISTGDELVRPDETPGPGQIRDINSYTINARSISEGFNVLRIVVLRDERNHIIDALADASAGSDVVVISGGSSKGFKDMTAELIGEVADSGVLTHGIAAKPGKPTITGFDSKSGTIYLGLPGHPAAALMVYEQILIRLWRDLTRQEDDLTVKARITANIPSAPGRRTFQLIRFRDEEMTEAEPVIAKSGMISPMSIADGYFEMSENREGVKAGDIVEIRLWR
ncbi:MAG: molybdopterin molybdotransferase MoeA [Mogibacterium sp.]|nr:molybdopterin molybdotransferase MoeA [Mogibacterium sp.]